MVISDSKSAITQSPVTHHSSFFSFLIYFIKVFNIRQPLQAAPSTNHNNSSGGRVFFLFTFI